MFLYLNIIRINGENAGQARIMLLDKVESFNNISAKIAYDIGDQTNIYIKYLYEDHSLLNTTALKESRQVVLGVQYHIPFM